MSKLFIFQKEVHGIFELLGRAENDITYALGWCLANSEQLRINFFHAVTKEYQSAESTTEIMLQTYGTDKGFTDIEILNDTSFWIIEAKKGWHLPTQKQLNRYIARFAQHSGLDHRLIVISEYESYSAKEKLKQYSLRLPIQFMTWQEICCIIKKSESGCRGPEKVYLNQLAVYYRKVITMQNKNSNEVFCVVASDKNLTRKFSFLDVVKKGFYFYPVRGKWPKIPPTYLAVRSRGKLLSIHYVKSYHITEKPNKYFPELKRWKGWSKCPHYVLKLGKPFKPNHEVKNGRIYPNAHIRCRLDALFTCATIQDARDQSKMVS